MKNKELQTCATILIDALGEGVDDVAQTSLDDDVRQSLAERVAEHGQVRAKRVLVHGTDCSHVRQQEEQ